MACFVNRIMDQCSFRAGSMHRRAWSVWKRMGMMTVLTASLISEQAEIRVMYLLYMLYCISLFNRYMKALYIEYTCVLKTTFS